MSLLRWFTLPSMFDPRSVIPARSIKNVQFRFHCVVRSHSNGLYRRTFLFCDAFMYPAGCVIVHGLCMFSCPPRCTCGRGTFYAVPQSRRRSVLISCSGQLNASQLIFRIDVLSGKPIFYVSLKSEKPFAVTLQSVRCIHRRDYVSSRFYPCPSPLASLILSSLSFSLLSRGF